VTLLTERAQVKYDHKKTSPKKIVEAVEEIGFTAVEEDKSSVVLNIGGMTCAACVNTVESVLLGTPGVATATVNLLTGKAKITFGKNAVAVRDLIESVEEVGFEASVNKDRAPLDIFRKLSEIEYYRRSFFVAVVFNLAFMALMAMRLSAELDIFFDHRLTGSFTVGILLEWMLSTPVNFWVGRKIHVGAIKVRRKEKKRR
jgi:Cu+-exporting ATPase